MLTLRSSVCVVALWALLPGLSTVRADNREEITLPFRSLVKDPRTGERISVDATLHILSEVRGNIWVFQIVANGKGVALDSGNEYTWTDTFRDKRRIEDSRRGVEDTSYWRCRLQSTGDWPHWLMTLKLHLGLKETGDFFLVPRVDKMESKI